jgi:ribonuclease-3
MNNGRNKNIKVELTELEDLIGYRFKNIALLEEAITTGSYSNEHPGSPNYQRFEFLGDRVISLILAEELAETFPVSESLDEGTMTFLKSELENNKRLAEYGEEIGLRNYIRASEKRENISPNVIADVFEAICGAIYMDTEESIRINEVEKFLLKFGILERIKEEKSSGGDFRPIRNQFENKFREINRCNPGIDFKYSSTGEEHQKRWKIEKCSIKDDTKTGEYIELKGVKSDKWFNTKQNAETDAIKQAYEYMEKKRWKL